jgi:hypothetical protein
MQLEGDNLVISEEDLENGAEIDFGIGHRDGEWQYRISMKKIDDSKYEIYRRYSYPADMKGHKETMKEGSFDECVDYVKENYEEYKNIEVSRKITKKFLDCKHLFVEGICIFCKKSEEEKL